MGKLSKLSALRSSSKERARSFITNQVALNVFCPTGKGGGVNATCSPKGRSAKSKGTSQDGRDITQSEDSYHKHLGVNRVVEDLKTSWGYHGEVNVLNQQGRTFEVGGVQWREGGNCHLASGKITIHSQSAGDSISGITGLAAHEMMHGTWEKVHSKFIEERNLLNTPADTKSGVKMRMDGSPYKQFENEVPTYTRIQRLYEAGGLSDKLKTEDGITEYSKAYWKDFETSKVSFHIAVHETLAEIAAIHESTGVIEGSKVYRDLYKGIRDEYQVIGEVKSKRSGPGLTTNQALYTDHIIYLDANLNPTGIEKAVYLHWWKSDGTSGWGTKIPPTINAAKKKLVNPLLVDPTRTTTLQRAFEEQLSKRFAKFQKALIAYMTSGGLTTNAFCPTGEGGGVNPTCSPKSTQVQIVRPKSKNESFEDEIIFKLPQGRMGVAKSKWAPTDWSVTDTFVEEDSRRQGVASKLIEAAKTNLQGTIGAQCSSDKSVNLFWKHGFRLESGSIEDAYSHRKEYSSVNLIYTPGFTTNAFKFETSAAKVENFEQWIISKLTETMEDKDIYSGKDWWKTYVERAYKQGADRAFDTMKKKGKQDQRSSDRMAGAKNQFFSTFGSDAAKERMKLIAARTYKGMKGLTDSMKSQLTLTLIDGLLKGDNPKKIATALVDQLGISKTRAKAIARSEIIRSHSEGTLATLKALGVQKVGVQVEVAVSGNACPICQKYKNRILTIEEAEGLFPLHVNCRCTPVPHVSDEPSPQKERQRKNIESSIKSATKSK